MKSGKTNLINKKQNKVNTKENIMFDVLNNTEEFYEGNLWYYFGIIFNAPNVDNPYHNFRHLMHVTCTVYIAGKYMNYHKEFGKESFRALLIAAMFHDYGHSGIMGNDKAEVDRSISEMKKHLLPHDSDFVDQIETFIRATQFPYVECEQNLGTDIIRDADMSPLFDDVWIQQVIFGIAKEMRVSPRKMLENQLIFIPSMIFHTKWAKEKFLPMIEIRLMETQKMLNEIKKI